MKTAHLHIFALNAETDARHTFLSRSKGEVAKLPDLAGWLSLRQGGLDTDNIELFAVSDLGDLRLSNYVATAFDPLDPPLNEAAPKLNALEGHVLLIPDAALAGSWTAGQHVTLVASLPLAVANHAAEALKPAASNYGQPSQDNIGWHTKAKPHRRKLFGIFSTFFVVSCILLVLAALG